MWGGAWGATQQRPAVVWGWVLEGEWNLVWGLLLICKVRPLRRSHILAGTPSDSSAAKYAAASSSIKRPRHSLSGLPSLSPYWASPFLSTLASLMLNISMTLPPFKADRLPTASLPSLHTLYLASLLFFKHDGLIVFPDNFWLINDQPSSWIKVFYEKWCPSSFLTLPTYVNIFQLQTWSDPPGGSRVTLTLKIYFSSTDKINA